MGRPTDACCVSRACRFLAEALLRRPESTRKSGTRLGLEDAKAEQTLLNPLRCALEKRVVLGAKMRVTHDGPSISQQPESVSSSGLLHWWLADHRIGVNVPD